MVGTVKSTGITSYLPCRIATSCANAVIKLAQKIKSIIAKIFETIFPCCFKNTSKKLNKPVTKEPVKEAPVRLSPPSSPTKSPPQVRSPKPGSPTGSLNGSFEQVTKDEAGSHTSTPFASPRGGSLEADQSSGASSPSPQGLKNNFFVQADQSTPCRASLPKEQLAATQSPTRAKSPVQEKPSPAPIQVAALPSTPEPVIAPPSPKSTPAEEEKASEIRTAPQTRPHHGKKESISQTPMKQGAALQEAFSALRSMKFGSPYRKSQQVGGVLWFAYSFFTDPKFCASEFKNYFEIGKEGFKGRISLKTVTDTIDDIEGLSAQKVDNLVSLVDRSCYFVFNATHQELCAVFSVDSTTYFLVNRHGIKKCSEFSQLQTAYSPRGAKLHFWKIDPEAS